MDEQRTIPRELSFDALVAPAGILPGQSKDQRNHVVGECWTPTLSSRLRPLAGHQPAVPPQDDVRRDEEDGPVLAGKRPAQRGEDRAIGGSELGSGDLAA